MILMGCGNKPGIGRDLFDIDNNCQNDFRKERALMDNDPIQLPTPEFVSLSATKWGRGSGRGGARGTGDEVLGSIRKSISAIAPARMFL
jgi:hypothetical protein